MGNISKTISYLGRNGIKKTYYMVRQRLSERDVDKDYEDERIKELASHDELLRQKEETVNGNIKFSILVPAYETPEEYLMVLVDSVLRQSYENFELIIADASVTDSVREVVTAYDDERIVYRRLAENGGISDNTNAALLCATGDVICPVDHDDFLEPDALYCLYNAFNNGAQVCYTDEDKYNQDSGTYFKANRKPDYNKDMLLSNNYICHLFAVKTHIARAVGGYKREYDGAQDYDFILKCIDEALKKNNNNTDVIKHISKVLYHWRVHESSTAENPKSKLYAYEAGRTVVADYISRHDILGEVKHTEHRGFYKIYYNEPKADIIKGLVWSIPDGLVPDSSDYEKLMVGYFQRPEVRAVCARVLDKKGIVQDSRYAGMHFWDSGLMHRAHIVQDVNETTEVYVVNPQSEGSIIVYDPQIVFRRK